MLHAGRRIPAFLLCAFLVVLAACGGSASGGASSGDSVTLEVFAAASLKDAFGAIKTGFERAYPGVTVQYSFGGSDTLAAQINQGAPADVFASANIAQMNAVVKAGGISSSTPSVFAHNRLVVIYPKANPAGIATLHDLAKSGLKLVLAAKSVPAGQYALDFLTKATADPSYGPSYKTQVLANVVSYETDVRSVLSKVALGEGDAGIVYVTDAATQASALGTLAIPDALNSVATYPIAPVTASKHADVAHAFVAYVLGADGQAALARYGFLPGTTGPQYVPPTGA